MSHAHLESILPKVQCNSSKLDLNLKHSSVYLQSRAQYHSCKTPNTEIDHMITLLARAYEQADHVGPMIYPIQFIKSFPRCQASDRYVSKETQMTYMATLASGNAIILSFELAGPAYLF